MVRCLGGRYGKRALVAVGMRVTAVGGQKNLTCSSIGGSCKEHAGTNMEGSKLIHPPFTTGRGGSDEAEEVVVV